MKLAYVRGRHQILDETRQIERLVVLDVKPIKQNIIEFLITLLGDSLMGFQFVTLTNAPWCDLYE